MHSIYRVRKTGLLNGCAKYVYYAANVTFHGCHKYDHWKTACLQDMNNNISRNGITPRMGLTLTLYAVGSGMGKLMAEIGNSGELNYNESVFILSDFHFVK